MSLKILIALFIVSLAVAASRFLPGTPVPAAVTQFADGFAVGIGIAAIVVWLGQRE